MADYHDDTPPWVTLIRTDIHGIHDRLDRLNGRTRDLEQDVAVLKDRSGHGRASIYGAGMGGFVVAIVEAFRYILGR